MRRVAPRHASIREVEGRLLQAEKRIVARGSRRDQKRRRQPTFAAGERGLEGGGAVGIGLLDREHLVVAC